MTLEFPDDFLWGAATATPQPDDVPLVAALGLSAYRFSLSWARIQPAGRGPVDTVWLDHYERVVDELVEHGVTPVLTLHHRDLPRELADAGGWGERDTAARFAEYAELVGTRLGDRVPIWNTLNEPWCAAFLGYAADEHAPALSLRAAHHLLLAHGSGTAALRTVLPATARVSITLNLSAVLPAVTSSAATNAVRRIDGLGNRLFLDPLFRGRYPADVRRDTATLTDWAFVRDGDLDTIGAPIDLLGVNYHAPTLVDAGTARPGPSPWPACGNVEFVPPPTTAMGSVIDEQGLRNVMRRVHDEYAPIPLMITEDGAAFDDGRSSYLSDHLTVVHDALTHGVDLRGYFVWSHVDHPTRRVWKDTAHWYRQVIRTNSIELA